MERIITNKTADTTVNMGLRAYFNDVFNRMICALLTSGVFAYIGSKLPVLYAGGALTWLIILSPLAFVMTMSFAQQRFTDNQLLLMLMGFSAAQGLSLGTLLIIFTAHSITVAFLMAAIVFGTFSIIGYSTRRDLSAMGTFMFVGLIGIIIASLVNLFLQAPAMSFVISILAIIIFTGLTAYDMQKLKLIYLQGGDSSRVRTMGALSLYLDFINIFISILHLLGNRR
jgi:FtsH-binding integral membrane protein